MSASFKRIVLGMLCVVCLSATPDENDVRFTHNIPYGKGGDEELLLNLSRPKSDAKNLPCIVFIHGGGWAGGHRGMHDSSIRIMARRGYVAAGISYRFAPKHKFPAQLHDVKCAVRFLRAHADEYGLDPNRVAVCGYSAGGHLAMMLGTTTKEDGFEGDGGWPEQSSRVQAVVSFFGPTDLTAKDIPVYANPLLANFIGGPLAEKREDYERASPVHWVSPGDAPMLLFQGTGDSLVPYTQAYRMLDAMTAAGVQGRANLLVGAGHGWFGDAGELKRTADEAFVFLDEHLKPAAAATTQPISPKR